MLLKEAKKTSQKPLSFVKMAEKHDNATIHFKYSQLWLSRITAYLEEKI